MPDMNQATNPVPVSATEEAGLSLSDLRAKVLSARRERGSIEDPELSRAGHLFDAGPERLRVNELIEQLRELDPSPCDGTNLWFQLDNAISDLVGAAEDWVLDRMVIGLWDGDMPCVSNWRATRRTVVDPIEYAAEQERREAEIMKAHGLTTTADEVPNQ
jgi:hypothetical protein